MKAAAEAQRRLLDLQASDTALARLEHRRSTLPETTQARALQADRGRAAEQVIGAETVVSDLEGEQAKAESDLGPVRERLARNEKRVADGSITDAKALQGLLEEIQHLKTRISDLEDVQLDAMERLETAREAADRALEAKSTLEDNLRSVLKEREAKLAELAAERVRHETERDAIAAAVPRDLLALYTRIAEKSDGVGAAVLRQNRCGGCQLEANSSDLARFRAAAEDEVLRCEECNRILVRTAESGL